MFSGYLKLISMQSLFLIFMLVSAKFPLLQRYIVETGSNVPRFAEVI